MDLTGEQRIPAPRAAVWRALNDAEVLRRCIPGCQELVKHSDTEMTAVAVVKVGPISARFQGAVTLSDLDPPKGYRITGEGQGGVAGHAKGGAQVTLEEDGEETILRYVVSAQIGGKLAQLGGRMIDATAKTMSAAFFRKFSEEVTGGGKEAMPTASDPTGAGGQPAVAAPAPAVQPATVVAQVPSVRPLRDMGFLVAGAGLAVVAPRIGVPPGWLDVLLIGSTGYLLGALRQK